jgi:hypothetical protein
VSGRTGFPDSLTRLAAQHLDPLYGRVRAAVEIVPTSMPAVVITFVDGRVVIRPRSRDDAIDVTLTGPVEVLERWIADRSARLGPLLLGQVVTASGELWALSLLEHWVATAGLPPTAR